MSTDVCHTMPPAKGSVSLPNQMRPAVVYRGSSNSDTVKNSNPEKQKGLLHRGYKKSLGCEAGRDCNRLASLFQVRLVSLFQVLADEW